MPPPAKCEEAERRQAASVAVKNNAFPSTTYLVSIRELPFAILSERLHDGKLLTMRSAIMLPMQWPRHLDQICFPRIVVEVELLRVGKRNCSRLASHLTIELHTSEVAFATLKSYTDSGDRKIVANRECCVLWVGNNPQGWR